MSNELILPPGVESVDLRTIKKSDIRTAIRHIYELSAKKLRPIWIPLEIDYDSLLIRFTQSLEKLLEASGNVPEDMEILNYRIIPGNEHFEAFMHAKALAELDIPNIDSTASKEYLTQNVVMKILNNSNKLGDAPFVLAELYAHVANVSKFLTGLPPKTIATAYISQTPSVYQSYGLCLQYIGYIDQRTSKDDIDDMKARSKLIYDQYNKLTKGDDPAKTLFESAQQFMQLLNIEYISFNDQAKKMSELAKDYNSVLTKIADFRMRVDGPVVIQLTSKLPPAQDIKGIKSHIQHSEDLAKMVKSATASLSQFQTEVESIQRQEREVTILLNQARNLQTKL
jgi:hypothetical protein